VENIIKPPFSEIDLVMQ